MTSHTSPKKNDIAQLDSLTQGIFSAATAGDRAARTRDWIASGPSPEQLADVFKELSIKDKGAAKLVREKLDEAKRAKGQEALAADWASKASALLALPKLNIADALAWQRDAAKAGAPLSKEPLASLKTQLAERVRSIEDLQHQVQIQREAAVLLAQRIEVLSTKPWQDAQSHAEGLQTDVAHWQSQAQMLTSHASWSSVDLKFPPLLEASRSQLLVVWEAFQGVIALAVAAAADPSAPLPPVPVWAEELRAARGLPPEPATKAPKAAVDPAVRASATAAVQDVLGKLEAEIAQGHGKASAGAAAALRQALKEFSKLIDPKLEHQASSALAAAGELEGWQRWRADQLREALVAKAEALLQRPAGQEIGGRKMQESLRTLREQWKETDQGGVPNHALWKRFDHACNEAYKVVDAWLEKIKTEAAANKAQRLALIEEVNAWANDNRTARDGDWRGFHRVLLQFGERWRNGGHVGEKLFAELQPLWKTAIHNAAAPLEALQAQSLEVRQAMIEESQALGGAPMLRMDAVKALQQRWQAEVHRVPMDRRQEQKLWDAFRKPIDEAFQRKTAEREKAEQALGVRDRAVLDAAKALDAANASGDAQAIRSAIAALEAALQGQAQAQQQVQHSSAQESAAQALTGDAQESATPSEAPADASAEHPRATDAPASEAATEQVPAAPTPKPAAKPVIAVRGDDRPGMKKDSAAPAARNGKFSSNRDNPRGPRDAGAQGPRGGERNGERHGERYGDRNRRPEGYSSAPRLGDTAFRAQRDALEKAQQVLKNLAAQAHGEILTQVLSAWEQRDANVLPKAQELGGKQSNTLRSAWQQALASAPQGSDAANTALLRLEMAAEVPTPADHLNARRALQLQLLTRRNDATPTQTWAADTATVFSTPFDAQQARRLQTVLKVLLKR